MMDQVESQIISQILEKLSMFEMPLLNTNANT